MREQGSRPPPPPNNNNQKESFLGFKGGAVTDHGAECREELSFLTANVPWVACMHSAKHGHPLPEFS